jgi:NAD(P)-dependent dehydrogenase (short-subunit alcohol dehydrogenase family)
VLAVNLTAPFTWARAAIPALLDAGGGAIVNIASIDADFARPRTSAYVTSKAGLLGLTRSIAIDFGRRGIRCNAISPSSIDTEMLRAHLSRAGLDADAQIARNHVGRLGTAEEVAAACAYLLSDEAGFVNGANLVIDGARTATA